MKRHSEKGMALVITLMMLAIVTFMAVVFLSLSRRERGNVKIAEDQVTARLMADSGLDRAKADLVAGMNNKAEELLGQATNNPQFGVPTNQQHVAVANRAVQRALFAYDLRTSKNFYNPNGFSRKASDKSNPWNVGYYDTAGNVYDDKGNRLNPTSDDYYQHLANQQYDPRPPVIVSDGKTNDNRFYIDLNRNGMFDPNLVLDVTGPNNERYNRANLRVATGPPYFNAYFSGDPEWIGVLERPDLPHSETNRFIGRYAYIMLPTGKSLDINFIHNVSMYDQPNIKYDGVNRTKLRYSRNQGVGSWELNMAAFLVDFHTNVWRPNPSFYSLDTNSASGFAFRNAVGLLQYRYNNTHSNLFTARELFGATNRWALDYVDMPGDGPFVPYNVYYNASRPNFSGVNPDNDADDRFWFGAEHMERTSEFPDVQRYFRFGSPTTATSEQLDFYQRFTNAVSSTRTNTYDRYAYYRWLAQMGADSRPALDGKIHLNFANEPGTISTNLTSWVTNSGLPALLIRSNTAVAVKRNDGGAEYVPTSNGLTNFFLITADAMLKASLVTNVFLNDFGNWQTNYTIGSSYFHDPSLNTVWNDPNPNRRRYVVATPVRPDISITNIQIYHEPYAPTAWRPIQNTYTNAEYTAALHRILQLAANVYDSMTNNSGRTGRPVAPASPADAPADPYFPTVFRPIYGMTSSNIVIVGWQPEETANYAANSTTDPRYFRSAAQFFTNQNGIGITNVSFYGQPWVIGAKKGWPNFNEFSIETYAQVTRKLEIFKDLAGRGKPVDTNNLQSLADHTRQIYMIGFSNTFGIEAWNSYFRTNQRPTRLIAEVRAEFGVEQVLQRDANSNVVRSVDVPLAPSNRVVRMVNSVTSSNWPGRKGQMHLTNAFPNLGDPLVASGGSDFRVPIYNLIPVLPDSEFSTQPPGFYRTPARFDSLKNTPDLRLNITNRVRYLAVDIAENRVIDYVTFDNLVTSIDLDKALRGEQSAATTAAGGNNLVSRDTFWVRTPVSKAGTPELTQGVMRQIEVGLGLLPISQTDWKNFSIFDKTEGAIRDFVDYINGVNTNQTIATNVTRQVPFSPTRQFYMMSAYQANDPFVHYTIEDLRNPMMETRPSPYVIPPKNEELGRRNTKRQAIRYDGRHGVEFQDPRIFESDNWQFPIAKLDDPTRNTPYGIPNFHYRFPNIGALGQIHRGTPWQTVYLKAAAALNVDPRTVTTTDPVWVMWAGSYGTHPTNDWKFVGLFTTAITDNAARGLLSVNQANTAAWSAALSGIPVITNSWSDNQYNVKPNRDPRFGVPNNPQDAVGAKDLLIEPGSMQLSNIVRSINAYRAYRPMGLFSYLGEVLGAPMLSYGKNPDPFKTGYQWSPYLNITDAQVKAGGKPDGPVDWHAFTDEALEAIPQRVLSLLKEDEPRVTIYCFGQTLKPAARSFVTSADFYNLCVNYQVSGEYVTKAVVRVEGEFKNPENPLRTVVESFEVLAPFE